MKDESDGNKGLWAMVTRDEGDGGGAVLEVVGYVWGMTDIFWGQSSSDLGFLSWSWILRTCQYVSMCITISMWRISNINGTFTSHMDVNVNSLLLTPEKKMTSWKKKLMKNKFCTYLFVTNLEHWSLIYERDWAAHGHTKGTGCLRHIQKQWVTMSIVVCFCTSNYLWTTTESSEHTG